MFLTLLDRVNNCVGRHNYRWFLLLLLSLATLLSYGTLLALILLAPEVRAQRIRSGHNGPRAIIQRWGSAFVKDARIGGVGLLAAFTGPLAFGLLGYHVYLIWLGATTNETGKCVHMVFAYD